MSAAYQQWLRAAATARDAAGTGRRLRPRTAEEQVLDLAGNDYLGLARHPAVVDAACGASRRWGTGSTGSRLVTGSTAGHRDLEDALAAFTGAETALLFSSGYAANLGAITALADDDTLIVSDERNHASLIDGCRLSRARVVVAAHGDVDAAAHLLRRRRERRALVVTDAVFSVDGDRARLPELQAVCRARDALLLVDEAHAFGVLGDTGAGLVAAHGLAGDPAVVRTITLSKALGSQGGAVLGSPAVIEHLVNAARTFIFDTALAPGCVGAAHAALDILRADPTLPATVRRSAARLAETIDASPPDAAVISLVLGDPQTAVAAAEQCRAAGVLVGCFRPPSVPPGTSRLRVTARADLTTADIDRAGDVIRAAAKAHA